MAFTLPTFNLVCNVYRGDWLFKVLAITDQVCNLAYARRGSFFDDFNGLENSAGQLMYLLLPPLVDVRDLSCAAVQDVIECPSGSGRWYQVASVEDIGKGFPNEHRCARLFKISEALFPGTSYAGLMWPAPIP